MKEGSKWKSFNLQEYMNKCIENIVKSIVKVSPKNPRETAFVMKCILGYIWTSLKCNYSAQVYK